MDFAAEPFARIAKAILHFDVAFTGALPLDKPANVSRAVAVSRLPGTVALALFPVTFIAITVGKRHYAIAMVLRILEAAFIDQPIGVGCFSGPFNDSGFPISLICRAIWICDCAHTLRQIIQKGANIDRPIRVAHFTAP